MIFLKGTEFEDNALSQYQQEFTKMGATDFLNFMEEFRKIPFGKERSLCKEAYCQEYLRRYNKDVFHQIPSYKP